MPGWKARPRAARGKRARSALSHVGGLHRVLEIEDADIGPALSRFVEAVGPGRWRKKPVADSHGKAWIHTLPSGSFAGWRWEAPFVPTIRKSRTRLLDASQMRRGTRERARVEWRTAQLLPACHSVGQKPMWSEFGRSDRDSVPTPAAGSSRQIPLSPPFKRIIGVTPGRFRTPQASWMTLSTLKPGMVRAPRTGTRTCFFARRQRPRSAGLALRWRAPRAGQQLCHELRRDMARGHFEEQSHAQLAQDFERIVPPDRMRDVRGQIPHGSNRHRKGRDRRGCSRTASLGGAVGVGPSLAPADRPPAAGGGNATAR